jgi:transposase
VWRCLQGQPSGAIAAELKLDRRTVHHWLTRFDAGGLDALEDAPRQGRPATYSPEERAEGGGGRPPSAPGTPLTL